MRPGGGYPTVCAVLGNKVHSWKLPLHPAFSSCTNGKEASITELRGSSFLKVCCAQTAAPQGSPQGSQAPLLSGAGRDGFSVSREISPLLGFPLRVTQRGLEQCPAREGVATSPHVCLPHTPLRMKRKRFPFSCFLGRTLPPLALSWVPLQVTASAGSSVSGS